MDDEGSQHGWRTAVEVALAATLFGVALLVLRRELSQYRYQDLVEAVTDLGRWRVLGAIALTAVNYLALTGYDALALRIVGQKLEYRRVALASFIAYVFSHNVGLSFLGGGAVRFRLYSSWGIGSDRIAAILFINAITFWLGFVLLLACTLLAAPPAIPARLHFPAVGPQVLGALSLVVLVAYLALTAARRTPLHLWGRDLALPTFRVSLAQLVLSTIDWLLAAAVLWVLLPASVGPGFASFVAIYLSAQIVALVSHVPAGLGVFETVIILMLGHATSRAALLGSLLAYRLVYYLVPLAFGTLLLVAHEGMRRREALTRFGRLAERWSPAIVPQALAIVTFLGGTVLLVSGATPAVSTRLGLLDDILGLSIIELSHLAGSMVGVGLLVLARGLQLRLDAAYLLTIILLGIGIVASLLKGLDYEEAALLLVALALVLPCRRHFYRRASLLDEPLSGSWLLAVALVAIGTGWLTLFSYQHVEYSRYLWWQFELAAEAPRALRAAAGVIGTLAVYGAVRLLRPARAEPHPATDEELAAVRSIVAAARESRAHLALLGDKLFLVNDARSAFVMYAVAGRSWIAMGDPVGSPAERRELAWEFYELADRHAGWPVFYEVDEANLSLYLDLGLGLLKLGEGARIRLPTFSLEGAARKYLRQNHHRLERLGCAVEILPPEGVDAVLPDLRQISDAWLADKETREKGFSLGCFAPTYLRQFPIAVVRQNGRAVAFANLWLGGGKSELSVDLMRYLPDAPSGVMDYLFVDLIVWGKQQGFEWFDLGMAPLSGFEQRALAPLWTRLGAFAFRYGEAFYNFKGLRQYKQKFDPDWTPRYLASPGGVALPLILANVASLISGGLTGVLKK